MIRFRLDYTLEKTSDVIEGPLHGFISVIFILALALSIIWFTGLPILRLAIVIIRFAISTVRFIIFAFKEIKNTLDGFKL